MNNRNEVGTGLAAQIPCLEVQKAIERLSDGKPLDQDENYEANVVAHALTCVDCSKFLNKIFKEKLKRKDAKPDE